MSVTQGAIDAGNARFWDELCGSALARELGIEDASAESLRRFDDAYMELYPYLDAVTSTPGSRRREVLEVGLGYGTRERAARRARRGAVRARHRRGACRDGAPPAALMGRPADERIVQGSALQMPFADASFDRVYSIGCLHHTGDLPRAVAEVHRVLRPGGRAVVMLYNRHSFRFLVRRLLRRRSDEELRGDYDSQRRGRRRPRTPTT